MPPSLPCSKKFWLQAQSLYVQISPLKRVNTVCGFKMNSCSIRKLYYTVILTTGIIFLGGGMVWVWFCLQSLTSHNWNFICLIFLSIFDVCMLGDIF